MENKKGRSIANQVFLLVLVLLVCSNIAIGVMGFFMYRSEAAKAASENALTCSKAVAAAIDGDEMRAIGDTMETNTYWEGLKHFADSLRQSLDIRYLYVVDARYTDTFTTLLEGYDPASGEEEGGFGWQDPADSFPAAAFEAISEKRPVSSPIYKSDGYGANISSFAPVLDSTGTVVALVGTDVEVSEVYAASNLLGLITLLVALAFSVVAGLICFWFLKVRVGRPIGQLTGASRLIAQGDVSVEPDVRTGGEIGQLADSFREMVHSTRDEIALLERFAKGDLSMQVEARSAADMMSLTLQRMLDNLNDMFREIDQASRQVAAVSGQLAGSSQSLAQGAMQQAATMELLTADLSDVTDKTRQNSEHAGEAALLAESIKTDAERGSGQMEEMMAAVQNIDEASQSIAKVIKVIDDIAFQTNILALNAAVEAARAGEHGKGFAVVADEVRSLAAKSAEAARDTAGLIQNSVEKAALGVHIAGETSDSLVRIVQGIGQSHTLIQGIALASDEQNGAIGQINQRMDQISGVVQQNSATAQQSAAASQEMSSQAALLTGLVSRFQLRQGAGQLGQGASPDIPALPS